MRYLLLIAGLVLALVALAAEAAMKAGPTMAGPGHHRLKSPGAALDSFTTPAAVFSFRKLRSAYTGNAFRIRRASDAQTLDIGFLGATGFTGAPWNEAQAVAHCAATTCTIEIGYDQSGNGRDVTRAFPDQPAVIFGCQNGLACMQTSGAQLLLYPSLAMGAGGKGTISAVANRKAGAGTCYWMLSNGANGFAATSAGNWSVAGSSGSIAAAAAENTWHAGLGVLNDAASIVRIDATETTGTVTASAATGPIYVDFGAAATTCALAEAIYWDGYYLTAAERAALTSNQRNFWNF